MAFLRRNLHERNQDAIRRVQDPKYWGKPKGTPITPEMKSERQSGKTSRSRVERVSVNDVQKPPKVSATSLKTYLRSIGIDPVPGRYDYAAVAKSANEWMASAYLDVRESVEEDAVAVDWRYSATSVIEGLEDKVLDHDAPIIDEERFVDAPDLWNAFPNGVPLINDEDNPAYARTSRTLTPEEERRSRREIEHLQDLRRRGLWPPRR